MMCSRGALSLEQEVGVSDVVLLEPLTEEAFIANLYQRFKRDQIYTYIGNVVISVNPYKKLALYSGDVIQAYQSRSMFDLPPHIYAIADVAYRSMRDKNQDQCMIISGESGSGKTEASKLVMHYVAAVSGKGREVDCIKEQLLQSNPLLEAFGNSKTHCNDNSSRFGKYMDIEFDFKGDPIGGIITNYLLEKSRVTNHTLGERNFHIFYQLLIGADIQLLKSHGSCWFNIRRNPLCLSNRLGCPNFQGIQWSHVDYFNNAVICDHGILATLDEECLRPGHVSDETFLHKLDQMCAGHPHYESRTCRNPNTSADAPVLSSDSFRIRHYAGTGDYVRLRKNAQWRKVCTETNDQYVVFADIINKVTRSGGKVNQCVPILFVVSTCAMLVMDHRTMQIKYRVPASNIFRLSLSPFFDDIAVFHIRPTEMTKKKGDFVFQTGHVIEIITKVFLVVQNATGKPPEINIASEFEANFGNHVVTFSFKSSELPEFQPGQMKIARKANRMEVIL